MGIFSFKNNSSQISLLVDIGSSSVSAGLVKDNQSSKPEVLASFSKEIAVSENLNSADLINNAVNSIESVIVNLIQAKDQSVNLDIKRARINDIHVFLALPWYEPKLQKIIINETSQRKIEQPYVNESFDRAVKQWEKEMQESLKDNSNNKPNVIIEKEIVQMKLNGYKVNKISGQMASKIELDIFLSSMSSYLKEKFSSAVLKHINSSSLKFHSYPLGAVTVLSSLFPEDKSFLFVDFTGEITDIAIVVDGAIQESHSFPVGKNHFLRMVARNFNIAPEIASSYITNSINSATEDELTLKVRASMNTVFDVWFLALGKIFKEWNGDNKYVSRVFVTADEDIASYISMAMKKKKATSEVKGLDTESVSFVGANFLSHFCNYTPGFIPDAFIGLEAIFLGKKQKSS